MKLVDELNYRGLLKDFSNKEDVSKILNTPHTIYCGFDPSASSMQLGNFVMISLLMRLQKAGHRIIVVVGGATGMIGDPSGKSKERNLLNNDQVLENTAKFKKQFARFLDFSDSSKAIIVNNYDWISKINILEYLRDFGKYFPVNYMLNKDTVAKRLESGISYTEFSYTILQAIDFLHLYREENCVMQIGGGDQWGNLTSGLELIRKSCSNEAEVAAFTVPLLLDEQGKKFGKSESGAMYLDPQLFSPYKLYQYFLNIGDETAIKYIKVFSFKDIDEIEQIINEHKENLGQRVAQKTLAYEIVSIVHGEEKAKEAVEMSSALFSGTINKLSKENILELLHDLEVSVNKDVVLEQLLIDIGACKSKRESRELINNNSISINGDKITDCQLLINNALCLFDDYLILRKGKKAYYLIKLL